VVALQYAEFIATVEREGEIGHEEAERAARATLETLAERISGGEARDVAEQLPQELRALLEHDGDAQPLSAEEFLQHVQDREHVPISDARRHAQAVFAALRRALTAKELSDLASELPRELQAMLLVDDGAGGDAGAPGSADDFFDRVARRASLDRETARRATEAVLETLAIRISGGEVDDLIKRLPPELHAPLERGRSQHGELAEPIPLKQFLMAVAEREGASRAEAGMHARAVLATLREAVGDQELEDVLSQLPHEYRSLVPAS
jgi:uncharacterized protein (DUF2267 family)